MMMTNEVAFSFMNLIIHAITWQMFTEHLAYIRYYTHSRHMVISKTDMVPAPEGSYHLQKEGSKQMNKQ